MTSLGIVFSCLVAPICRPRQVQTYNVGRGETANIQCEVEGIPRDINFVWKFNTSVTEVLDMPSSIVKSNSTISTISFKPMTPQVIWQDKEFSGLLSFSEIFQLFSKQKLRLCESQKREKVHLLVNKLSTVHFIQIEAWKKRKEVGKKRREKKSFSLFQLQWHWNCLKGWATFSSQSLKHEVDGSINSKSYSKEKWVENESKRYCLREACDVCFRV